MQRIICFVLAAILAVFAALLLVLPAYGQSPTKSGYVCNDNEVQYVSPSGNVSWIPKGPVSYVEGTLKPSEKVKKSQSECATAAKPNEQKQAGGVPTLDIPPTPAVSFNIATQQATTVQDLPIELKLGGFFGGLLTVFLYWFLHRSRF